jgi:hypothetical protein
MILTNINALRHDFDFFSDCQRRWTTAIDMP